ncbi:MAG TPA: THUMP domain-containing protein [Candidatus Bathyarchaeia archaeon]|nr:THUMP domain-containing protein [Candidatus Bathyarchaeia archaeon]
MIEDFNLLATTSRGTEAKACSELQSLLEEIGDAKAEVSRTGVSGLIAAKTTLNQVEIIKKFRVILLERPYVFRYTLRVIPVEKVVGTDLVEIELAATELGARIGEKESFRVTVEKRFTGTPTQSIIEAAASNIKRKVSLEKPDKILLIEVVGRLTGISLLNPADILSVMKEKLL